MSTDQHECPNTAAVAGLAREIEAVRRTVERLDRVAEDVGGLSQLVNDLVNQVDAASRTGVPLAAPSWLDLPEEMSAAKFTLRELVDWLDTVFLRYPDGARALPECWLWHPDVVEEVLWLMHAWKAAYRGEGATVQLAGDWHDRYRPGVVRRLRERAGTCSLDNHTPRASRPSEAQPGAPLTEALQTIAQWWAAHRADAPPEPTSEQLAKASGNAWGAGRR